MEELKIVMQTLMGLGQTAKEGFIWWLVITKLIPTLQWGAGIGSAIWVAWYALRRFFDQQQQVRLREREAEWALQACKTIRGVLGVYSYPSTKQDSQYLDESDYKDVVEAVRAVKIVASGKGAPE